MQPATTPTHDDADAVPTSASALAITLASLPDARTFEEPTAGLTTATQIYTLDDGSLLTLPVAVMAVGEGKAVDGAISPEEPAAIGDWPTDDDAAVASAQ